MRASKQLLQNHPEEDLLVSKCKVMGSSVLSIWDFISSPEKFKMTRPIAEMLAKQLKSIHTKNVRDTVMLAIAKPEFREEILTPLVEEILQNGRLSNGQIAANALSKIVNTQDSDIIAELLQSTVVDDARVLLISTYAKIAKKMAIPVLRKLTLDTETRSEALKYLSILGDTTIQPELTELAKSPDSFKRKIARDALKRLEKSKQKSAASNLN